MELALRTLTLVALFAATSVSPGLLLVRRLRLSPLERLIAAMAASWVVVYLTAFVLFLAAAPPAAYLLAAASAVLALPLQRADLGRLLRDRAARRGLVAFGGLLLWCFLLLCLTRHFSGGGSGGDWLEHFQRTAFFLRQPAPGVRADGLFIGLYELPARPPLQNLVAAFHAALLGLRFELFSLVFLCLNASVLLPCALFLGRFTRRGGRGLALLTALLALNPAFVNNATLTWTKLLAAFYVLLGAWFYLRELSRPRRGRLAFSALCLAAGILVHYSALPYALAIGLHWLLEGRRRIGTGAACRAAAAGAGLLATWFAWSIASFGFSGTFLSNTAVTDAAGFSFVQNVGKVLLNAWYTLVPHFARGETLAWFGPGGPECRARDWAFLAYQTCGLTLPGLLGGPLALLAFARRLRSPSPGVEIGFWRVFVVAAGLLGIASHGSVEPFGVAHIVLQPLGLLALALLAVDLPDRPTWVRRGAVLGLAIDASLGVLLHFHVQARGAQALATAAAATRGLSEPAAHNLLVKLRLGLDFWGDHLAGLLPGLQILAVIGAVGLAALAWRELERVRAEL